MADYKPLTDNEVRETASAYYAERQAKSLPQEQPAIVLVGGQPGAGKSAASSIVKAELAMQGGYVHVDADRMRERIRSPVCKSKKHTSVVATVTPFASGVPHAVVLRLVSCSPRRTPVGCHRRLR